MTPDLIHAFTISATVLIAVVLLIIIVSFVTVNRGDVSMSEESKHHRGHRY